MILPRQQTIKPLYLYQILIFNPVNNIDYFPKKGA